MIPGLTLGIWVISGTSALACGCGGCGGGYGRGYAGIGSGGYGWGRPGYAYGGSGWGNPGYAYGGSGWGNRGYASGGSGWGSPGYGYGGNRYGYSGSGLAYGGYRYGNPSYGYQSAYPNSNVGPSYPNPGFAYNPAYVAPRTDAATMAQTAVQGRNLGINEEPAVDANNQQGMKVTNVQPGTAAARAGLQVGDVIHSANGYLTQQPGNLPWIIANKTPNNVLTMDVRAARDGQAHTITAQLP
jgi:hypothetical protein